MRSTGILVASWVLIALAGMSLLLGGSMAMDVGTSGQSKTYSAAFCVIGFAILMGTAGAGLLVAVRRARAQAHQEIVEAQVLQVALARNGQITAAEVAMSSELSLPEAQAYLERMARSGHISVEVGEQGALVYNVNTV